MLNRIKVIYFLIKESEIILNKDTPKWSKS